MTMYEIEILQDTRNYIRWNVDQYVPKGIRNYSIEGHGKGTIHLIPEGKGWRDRISISKKSMKVIRKVEKSVIVRKPRISTNPTDRNELEVDPTDSKTSLQELRHRASKCFTNPGDAMIALQELKRRKGL